MAAAGTASAMAANPQDERPESSLSPRALRAELLGRRARILARIREDYSAHHGGDIPSQEDLILLVLRRALFSFEKNGDTLAARFFIFWAADLAHEMARLPSPDPRHAESQEVVA